MDSIIVIKHNGTEIGTIIKADYSGQGITFFSDNNAYLQVGYMNRGNGYVIAPHIHNSVERKIYFTEEILFVKNGKVRVDFYDDNKNYLESYYVYEGDIVVLKRGGHGFKFLENSEIFEVKQGPYLKSGDKVRYEPIEDSKVVIKR